MTTPTDDDFIMALLAGVGAQPPSRSQPRSRGVAADDDLAELAAAFTGEPSSAWPPQDFVPPPWEHPATQWVGQLLRHAGLCPPDVYHFPRQLDVQQIEHRDVVSPVLLIGLRVQSRTQHVLDRARLPRITTTVWGGRVEVDGQDLLDRRDIWATDDDARDVGSLAYDKPAQMLTTTFAVAITVTEPMRIKRTVVRPNGEIVKGSTELWVVEGGQVRRVEQLAEASGAPG